MQALTGEGRLSGVVLLALPLCLFIAVYQLNRDYVMVLFSGDPMGTKMLVGAVIMQIVGASGDPQDRQHQGVKSDGSCRKSG